MKATESTLQELLGGQKQYQVPLYQRTYSWGQTQPAQLWDDITALADDYAAGRSGSHFMGSLVLAPSPGIGPVGGNSVRHCILERDGSPRSGLFIWKKIGEICDEAVCCRTFPGRRAKGVYSVLNWCLWEARGELRTLLAGPCLCVMAGRLKQSSRLGEYVSEQFVRFEFLGPRSRDRGGPPGGTTLRSRSDDPSAGAAIVR